MNRSEPAALTSALLVKKGNATPSSYATLTAANPVVSPPTLVAVNGKPTGIGEESNRHDDPRIRITLRLDPERHLKLKLTAAHLRQSLQETVIGALDAHLANIDPVRGIANCSCLVRVKAESNS